MTDLIPATAQGTPEKRQLALLRAVGLDRADPAQRELALAIADRYGLDLMLKHLVLIEGRPYLTRDGLLHIAHRSGQLDGIETTVPEIVGDEWRCTATVWRKDMSHPFTYTGRYPVKGGNARFAPEMATKVGESMGLRRAFDISAPSADERWDAEPTIAPPPAPRPTLAEVARERVTASLPAQDGRGAVEDAEAAEMAAPEDAEWRIDEMAAISGVIAAHPELSIGPCGDVAPEGGIMAGAVCDQPAGHPRAHRAGDAGSWPR